MKPEQILSWLKLGEAVVGSAALQRLIPALREQLPSIDLSDEQRAQLDANLADYDERVARAAAAADIATEG